MTEMPSTVVDVASGKLRRQILEGTRQPGTRLPAERDLAKELGISRLSLRAVLARLASEGLVTSRRGSGTEVQRYRDHAGVEVLGALAEVSFEQGRVPMKLIADLLEIRRMLAVEVIALVAERGQPEDFRGLREELATLADAPSEGGFMSRDLAFARTLVQAADNLPLELLFNSVVRVIQSHPRLSLLFDANSGGAVTAYGLLVDFLEEGALENTRSKAREVLAALDADTLRSLEEVAR